MYEEIRNRHFSNVSSYLSETAKALQTGYDVRIECAFQWNIRTKQFVGILALCFIEVWYVTLGIAPAYKSHVYCSYSYMYIVQQVLFEQFHIELIFAPCADLQFIECDWYDR